MSKKPVKRLKDLYEASKPYMITTLKNMATTHNYVHTHITIYLFGFPNLHKKCLTFMLRDQFKAHNFRPGEPL